MPSVALLTSGGDAPGMNTAVAAATKLATSAGYSVLGVEDGYDGLIEGRLRPLTPRALDGWWHRGGTVLGSARSARFRTPEGRAQAARVLADVDGLVVIGGNGSLTGARHLHAEHGVCVVGLPASIDNDIGCTSLAIGVDTALNTIVEACDRICDTASSHRRVFVVEVMGRECGYLAMAASVATEADAVLFREQGLEDEVIVNRVTEVVLRSLSPPRGKKRALVLKAEGVALSTDDLVHQLQARIAGPLPGVGVRKTVLGHVVRGGAPSFRDRMIAGRLAFGAIEAIKDGQGGVMLGWEPRANGHPTADPSVQRFPLDQVLHETRRLLDGSSPITQGRLRLLAAVQGALPL